MKYSYKIPKYILASKNIRFLNFLIDIFFFNVLKIIVYFFIALISSNLKNYSLLKWINTFRESENYLFLLILMFIYYSLFESISGRTVSKYFTKTIVVLEDGSKPKVIDILGRTLLRLIPLEYFTFLQGRKSGLHDEYSKTYVVKKNKLEKSREEFQELQYNN